MTAATARSTAAALAFPPRALRCRDCAGDGLSRYGRWLHEYGALVTEVDDRTARGADVPGALLGELAAVRDDRPDPEPCPCGTALACPTCHGTGHIGGPA